MEHSTVFEKGDEGSIYASPIGNIIINCEEKLCIVKKSFILTNAVFQEKYILRDQIIYLRNNLARL